MDTLHDILWNSTLEVLNFRLKLLAAKPITVKKADCIDAIKRCYAARGLEDIWRSLGELERLAVLEACHAIDCQLDVRRFKAKYGNAPVFCKFSEKDRYDSYRPVNNAEFATRLNLLLFTTV